jgi:hypothetical protein
VDEAHVEHAVGFVEHQDLDLAQVDGLLLDVVEQPARRGDDHVDPAAQRVDLRLHAHAAVDAGGLELEVLAVGANAFLDLEGELAGRRDDEAAHRVARGGKAGARFRRERCKSGSVKPAVLPVPVCAAPSKVAAREHYGNCLRLDGVSGRYSLHRPPPARARP